MTEEQSRGIYGEGHDLLISAIGKIPSDIRFCFLTGYQVEQAKFRVIPFEFFGENETDIVKCIHQDWFDRFDEIVGLVSTVG